MSDNRVSIGDVLLKELMIIDADPFGSKEELYDFISKKFLESGIVSDAEAFKESLFKREEQGSTYMGNEIAIPHGKCREVVKPGVGFIRCKKDFLYESCGETGPVKYVFVLAVSEGQEDHTHLRILATLAGYLARDEFLELIEKVQTYDELLDGINLLSREE